MESTRALVVTEIELSHFFEADDGVGWLLNDQKYEVDAVASFGCWVDAIDCAVSSLVAADNFASYPNKTMLSVMGNGMDHNTWLTVVKHTLTDDID